MSVLSCLNSVKNNPRNRPQSRRLQESCGAGIESTSRAGPPAALGKRTSSTRRLYNIEIVEEEQYKVKIHYTGFSTKYDEWIRRSQIKYLPKTVARREPDLPEYHFSVLACSIKQKLVPSRKLEDPLVKISIHFTNGAFKLLKQAGKSHGVSRGHQVYTVSQYSDLDDLLGQQWHLRVSNSNGDFSMAVLQTIRFYIMEPKPLLDFNAIKTSAGEVSCDPFYIQQQLSLIFQFVRQDGSKAQLLQLL